MKKKGKRKTCKIKIRTKDIPILDDNTNVRVTSTLCVKFWDIKQSVAKRSLTDKTVLEPMVYFAAKAVYMRIDELMVTSISQDLITNIQLFEKKVLEGICHYFEVNGWEIIDFKINDICTIPFAVSAID